MSLLGKITRLLEETGHEAEFHDSMVLNASMFLGTWMQHSGRLSGSLARPQFTADLASNREVLASCGLCLQSPEMKIPPPWILTLELHHPPGREFFLLVHGE